jgi:prepilin-type N-terminal cleavage/methylation domain-containing protein
MVVNVTKSSQPPGFTLLELVVVIVIIAALAGLVVSQVDRSREYAELTVARADLQTVSEAVGGSAAGAGYLRDMKYVPGFQPVGLRVHDLFSPSSYPSAATFELETKRGWRGPYLRSGGLFPASGDRRFAGDATFLERKFYAPDGSSRYGGVGDSCVKDPWGNPVVIQVPEAVAFTGAADEAKRMQYLRLVSAGPDGVLDTISNDATAAVRGDDLVLFPNRADVR